MVRIEVHFDMQSSPKELLRLAAVLATMAEKTGADSDFVGAPAPPSASEVVGLNIAYQDRPAPAAPPPPSPTGQQETANEAAEIDNELETAENPGNGKRRGRRTKAQIEADNAAVPKDTMSAALAAGLLPTHASVAVPPGVGMQPPPAPPPAAAPEPARPAVAIPPTAPPMQPQVPAEPEAPPASEGGEVSLAEFREAMRQMNATHQGLAYTILRPLGYFTPENIPPGERTKLLNMMYEASLNAPPKPAA